MKSPIVVGLGLTVAVCAACAEVGPGPSTTPEAVSPPASKASAARIVESGFKIMPGGGVTAAALIRNDTDQTLNEIQLELSLQDAGGREVAKTGESLPFCPPRQDCWWGAIFVDSSQFGADHKSIALVKTKILKDLGPRKDTPRLVELTAKGDEFVGASTEGMVFMIGFESGKPTSGMSQNIEKRVSPMAVSAGELKSSAGAQTVRAFLYEGVEQEGH